MRSIGVTSVSAREPESLWASTAAPAPPTERLGAAGRADVLVIGAGYTGLSTALHLAEAGTDVMVLEANAIGHGGSGRNMGQVNSGFIVLPDDIEAALGRDLGERMNEAFGTSGDLVFDLIDRHAIDCDAVRTGNLFLAHDQRTLRLVRKFHDQHLRRGAPMRWLEADETRSMTGSPRYLAGVLDGRSGNVQPLPYARGLARAAIKAGATIHEHCAMTGLENASGQWCARVESGATVTAAHVVLATDSYSDAVWPGLNRVLIPVPAQAIATEPLGENVGRTILDGGQATADRMRFVHYFKKDRAGRLMVLTGGPVAPAANLFRQFFPQLDEVKIEFHWAGIVGTSPDHLPQLHRPAPGVLAVTGYSGRGVTSATLVGRFLAKLLLGEETDIPMPTRPLQPRPWHGLQTNLISLAIRAGRYADLAALRLSRGL